MAFLEYISLTSLSDKLFFVDVNFEFTNTSNNPYNIYDRQRVMNLDFLCTNLNKIR